MRRHRTEDHLHHQQRPDLQDDGLHGYAARAGLEIVATYVDQAVSGQQEGRPQLQALMRAARQHAFACVLVWKFDRFVRSVAHLLRALEEFDYLGMRFIGMRFIGVQDQVDTASPMGKAMFTIIGAMAELEGASRVPVTPFYTGPEQTPAGHVSGTISPSSRAWLS